MERLCESVSLVSELPCCFLLFRTLKANDPHVKFASVEIFSRMMSYPYDSFLLLIIIGAKRFFLKELVALSTNCTLAQAPAVVGERELVQ